MVVCYSITSLGYAVLTVTASYTGFVLARVVSGENMFSRQWSNLWGEQSAIGRVYPSNSILGILWEHSLKLTFHLPTQVASNKVSSSRKPISQM